MEYYVYVYLNPLKVGIFLYDDIEFKFEPFYVGKGSSKWNRKKYHINESIRFIKGKIKNTDKLNLHKINTILNIKKELKSDPIIVEIFKSNDENKVILKEIELIKKIGRKDLNKGPLTNLTDGGESVGSYWKNKKREPFTLEHKNNLSKALRGNNPWCTGKKLYPETIEKIRLKQSGKKYSKEINEKKGRLDINHPRTILYKFTSPDKKVFLVLGNKGIESICLKFNLNFNSVKPYKSKRICKGKQEGWIVERIGIYKHLKKKYDKLDFK